MTTIGKIIEMRRKELGLTLEEVGNAVGVSKSTVKKWETGYIANMRRDRILALSKVLELNPNVLIDESDEQWDEEFEKFVNDITNSREVLLKCLEKGFTNNKEIMLAYDIVIELYSFNLKGLTMVKSFLDMLIEKDEYIVMEDDENA